MAAHWLPWLFGTRRSAIINGVAIRSLLENAKTTEHSGPLANTLTSVCFLSGMHAQKRVNTA